MADLLKDHSLHYIEMALRTDRIEKVLNPDGYGKRIGDCGDTVEFYLMTDGQRLSCVSFQVAGCMNTNACCNTVAMLSEGKTIDEAWTITPQDVVDYLETLEPDHLHCADLSVGAFYLALSGLKSRS